MQLNLHVTSIFVCCVYVFCSALYLALVMLFVACVLFLAFFFLSFIFSFYELEIITRCLFSRLFISFDSVRGCLFFCGFVVCWLSFLEA